MTSEYRLSSLLAARMMGLGLIGLAAVVFVLTLATAYAGWSLSVVVLVALLAVAAVAGFAWWLTRQVVLRMDERGYRVRMVRAAGTTEARWAEVEDAVTTTMSGTPCLVLRLRDGRTTTIPVEVVRADREALVADVLDHLDAAGGNPRARRRRTA